MYYSPISDLFRWFRGEFIIRIVIVAALLCAAGAAALILYRRGKISKYTAISGFALLAYTLFVLFITLIGRATLESRHIRLALFASYREFFQTGDPDKLRDIFINLLMFVPFAFLCAQFVRCLTGEQDDFAKPVIVAFIAGVMFTMLIECVQLAAGIGTFDVDDLMHNVVGTLIGITIWIIWDHTIDMNSRRQK